MDVDLMAGFHQQPDQSNYLAEGQTCKLAALASCSEETCSSSASTGPAGYL